MDPWGPRVLWTHGAQGPFRAFKALWAHGAQGSFGAFKALRALVGPGALRPSDILK